MSKDNIIIDKDFYDKHLKGKLSEMPNVSQQVGDRVNSQTEEHIENIIKNSIKRKHN